MDRYAQCIVDVIDKLEGFGKKKAEQSLAVYERYRTQYERQGNGPQSAQMAMDKAIEYVGEQVTLRARRAEMKLLQTAGFVQSARQAMTVPGRTSLGKKGVRAALNVIEDQQDIQGPSVYTEHQDYRARYRNAFENVLDNWSKGAFGRQLGKAHEDNVVKELAGEATGDKAAKDIADATTRTIQLTYADGRRHGGAVKERSGLDVLANPLSIPRVANVSPAQFADDMMDRIDWNRQTWPDGSLVADTERKAFLEEAHRYIASDGKYDFAAGVHGDQSLVMAERASMHQLFTIKDADSWFATRSRYGDNNYVFDTVMMDLDRMAWKNAVLKVLGPNPKGMIETIKRTVAREVEREKNARVAELRAAGKKVPKSLLRADADIVGGLKNFEIMADIELRHNPLDPENRIATIVGTTSNIMSAAMLKSAILTAVPGDLTTTMATRFANHQPIIRFLGAYVNALVQYRKANEFLIQMGQIGDDISTGNHTMQRWGGPETYGYAFSRRISDATMRASFMSRHTVALRSANAKEMMADLFNQRGAKLDDTYLRTIMRRAGITEREWDIVRNELTPYAPRGGNGLYIRPLDIYDLKHKDAPEIAQKFQAMLHNEGRRMVIATSIEATALMKRGLRPDSIAGAFAHSAAMFAGYGWTYLLTFSRMFTGMDSMTRKGGLVAGLVFGAFLSGAISQQLRLLIAGKEPDPMDNSPFWMKAGLTGGAFSLMSDVVSSAMQPDAQASTIAGIAGPLAGFTGEVVQLALADPMQWAGLADRLGDGKTAERWGSDLLDVAQRYIIPQTFYLAPILERDMLDVLRKGLDPQHFRRRNASRVRRAREQGTPYYAEPGQGILTGQ